ncbi:MAG: PD-(D/E)XK nuclease family protein [Leptolyngbyaceae cyanobacterium SL_1_1]|nr:PD-(D/E)XK nuclease family protein [Leptolyngbyaceae cyanobacterium SL_1_1]
MNAQPPLALSQGLLNLLTTCPRKFQYTYFDELGLPIAPEQQASVTWGSQFHLLMQQRELGLPIDSLPAMETDFRESLEALIAVAPDLFMPDLSPTDPVTFRQSEHRRTVEFGGYLLTVIYDLLILRSEQGQIIDWKTYLQPCSRLVLAQDWQTRLYPYVLAETTTLAPSQISITYWFVRHRDRQSNCLQPQQLTFAYGDQQHEHREGNEGMQDQREAHAEPLDRARHHHRGHREGDQQQHRRTDQHARVVQQALADARLGDLDVGRCRGAIGRAAGR